jgi:hypothetical protein
MCGWVRGDEWREGVGGSTTSMVSAIMGPKLDNTRHNGKHQSWKTLRSRAKGLRRRDKRAIKYQEDDVRVEHPKVSMSHPPTPTSYSRPEKNMIPKQCLLLRGRGGTAKITTSG